MNTGVTKHTGPVVLLVQPHGDTREMYAEFFSYRGFTPIAVVDGPAALEQVSRADVLVTDIFLPGTMDGFDLIAQVRRTQQTPIVVLTGSMLSSHRAQAERAGCNAYIVSPCSPPDLLHNVRQMLLPDGRHNSAKATLPNHKDAKRSA